MIKYTIIWALTAVFVYIFKYVLSKNDKKGLGSIASKCVFSGTVATVLVVSAYFINNIQGL